MDAGQDTRYRQRERIFTLRVTTYQRPKNGTVYEDLGENTRDGHYAFIVEMRAVSLKQAKFFTHRMMESRNAKALTITEIEETAR
jgi:hypothetical protein